jgi:hypothetical protein
MANVTFLTSIARRSYRPCPRIGRKRPGASGSVGAGDVAAASFWRAWRASLAKEYP